jgi:hypothetical protein
MDAILRVDGVVLLVIERRYARYHFWGSQDKVL